jgi:WD40 repeat protein
MFTKFWKGLQVQHFIGRCITNFKKIASSQRMKQQGALLLDSTEGTVSVWNNRAHCYGTAQKAQPAYERTGHIAMGQHRRSSQRMKQGTLLWDSIEEAVSVWNNSTHCYGTAQKEQSAYETIGNIATGQHIRIQHDKTYDNIWSLLRHFRLPTTTEGK